MVRRIPGRRGDQWSTLYRTRRRCGIHRSMVSCRLVSGAAGTSCTPLYRTRGERRISSSLRYVGFAGGAAGTTCTPLYRTRERVVISSAMCRCNGSQNFGTAGRKVCGIIWNKSRRRDSSRVHRAVRSESSGGGETCGVHYIEQERPCRLSKQAGAAPATTRFTDSTCSPIRSSSSGTTFMHNQCDKCRFIHCCLLRRSAALAANVSTSLQLLQNGCRNSGAAGRRVEYII